MANERCQFVKDGVRCAAYAITDSQFCFSHTPERKEEKREACRRGGGQKKKNLPPLELKTAADLPRAIANTIDELRKGNLSPKEANSIGKLLATYLRLYSG